MKRLFISLLNLLATVIDYFEIFYSFIFCKIQDFKVFYTIKKFVLGGSRVEGLWYSLLTHGSLYIEKCKTLTVWIFMGL